jgi:tetratricopeptide (TPR) repeat protein
MFQNGDIESAQKVFMQTIVSAKAAGDIEAQAESEAYGGHIAYMQGNSDLGASLTDDALRLSRKPGISPSVRVWSAIYYAWNRENMGFRSDENVRLLEYAVQESRDQKLPDRDTAAALDNLGADLELRGRLDEAERAFSEALAVYQRDPLALCDRSNDYGELAYISEMRGNPAASLQLYQQSYDGYKACSGAESRGALTELLYTCSALMKLGRAKEALPLLEGSMPAWRRIIGENPDLSDPLFFLSRAYVQTGRFADAEKTAKELVAVQEGKVAPSDRRFGASHMMWAEALAGQHRYQEALPHAEIAERLLANAISPGAKQMTAEAHQTLVEIETKLR